MLRRHLIAWGLAGCCSTGHASCDTGLAERMHAKLHPDRVLDRDKAACRNWHGFPGRYIVVLPLPRPAAADGSTEFDLDIMVVQQADNGNTDHARITSRLFESRVLREDAVRITDLQIDTARYALAPEVRAFGLRIRHSDGSRSNPYSNEELRLYVPQGERIRNVLDGLETVRERGEWDASCSGNFEQLRTSLAVSRKATSHGYANLLLSQTRSESQAVPADDGGCKEQEQPATFSSTTLEYNGVRYPIPPALRLE